MDDVQKLLAIEEIRNLKARYIIAVDRQDAKLLRETFAEDVVADYSATNGTGTSGQGPAAEVSKDRMGVFRGAKAMADAISNSYAGMGIQPYHTAGAPVIEVTSPTTATGVWPVISFSRTAPTEATPGTWYYYRDTYERIDGQWKIKTSKLAPTLD